MIALMTLFFLINQPPNIQKMLVRRNPEFLVRALAMDKRIQEKLGLSRDEIEIFREIYFETRKNTEKIKSEIRIKEIELEEIMQEERIDFDKAEKVIREISELNTQLRLIGLNTLKMMYERIGEKRFNEIREKLRRIWEERIMRRNMK